MSRHVEKNLKKYQTLGQKKCTYKHAFFFFSCNLLLLSQRFKNVIKMISANFFLQVIVLYTLHKRYSKNWCRNIWQMSEKITTYGQQHDMFKTCLRLSQLRFLQLCCFSWTPHCRRQLSPPLHASGKKKPRTMTPQSFYAGFQKALHVIKLLDQIYEKQLDDDKAKIIFFLFISKRAHPGLCAPQSAKFWWRNPQKPQELLPGSLQC